MSEQLTMYWGDELQAFAGGARMDLRFRIAVDLLKSRTFVEIDLLESGTFRDQAASALDFAAALIAEGEKRGWVTSFPDSDSISGPLRKAIARNQRANVYASIIGQRIAREEGSPVAVLPPGGVGPTQ